MSEQPVVSSVDDALAAMSAALDHLVTADLHSASGSLRELVSRLDREQNRLAAATLRAADALDTSAEWQLDGAASAQAWLRANLRQVPVAARSTVRTARRLRDLPQMQAALQEGEISRRHVEVVTDAMGRTEERRETVAAAETTFARAARQLNPRELSRVVERWKHTVDPAAGVAAEESVHAQRFCSVSTTFDGAVVVNAMLGPEPGAAVAAALEALSTSQYRTERAERLAAAGPGGDDPASPTPRQRRADALTELARRYLDSDESPEIMGLRPHVSILVTEQSLLAPPDEPGHEPAELVGVGPLSVAAARRILCDARVTGFTVDAHGQPLAYGRTQRVVPARLRRYLNLRDGGCTFPGCDRPVSWTEAHHLIPWELGGPTDAENLALQCVRHHHLLHEGGFTARGSPEDATLRFYRPDGTLLGTANRRRNPDDDVGMSA